ncbi:MAG: KEOPS complex kinase/ATPase Bud32 [Thermoplasmata archaeon]
MYPLIEKQLIANGAEAQILRGVWKERELIIKKRIVKGYRHRRLDEVLRHSRTKKEARLMSKARKAGVPTPVIYDVVPEKQTIVMEWFPGRRVMGCVENGGNVDMREVGKYIGKMHAANICHGDLTTSNILYSNQDRRYCFIDFSLGNFQADVEEKGVDLHLLKEALVSVHEDALDMYEKVLDGYVRAYPEGDEVIARTKDIESRGRYS